MAIGFSTYLIVADDGIEYNSPHIKSYETKSTNMSNDKTENNITVYTVSKIESNKADELLPEFKALSYKRKDKIKEFNQIVIKEVLVE